MTGRPKAGWAAAPANRRLGRRGGYVFPKRPVRFFLMENWPARLRTPLSLDCARPLCAGLGIDPLLADGKRHPQLCEDPRRADRPMDRHGGPPAAGLPGRTLFDGGNAGIAAALHRSHSAARPADGKNKKAPFLCAENTRGRVLFVAISLSQPAQFTVSEASARRGAENSPSAITRLFTA